jgi:hypothetical protein
VATSVIQGFPVKPRFDEKVRKERRLLFSVVVLIACVALSGLNGCAVSGTPRGSLSELRGALLNHDAEKALVYIDVDSIVDSFIHDIFARYQAKAEDPTEALGIRLGEQLATITRPSLSILVEKQVRAAIISDDQRGYFKDIKRASVWYFTIAVNGRTAIVEPRGNSDIRFKMSKTESGIWRIVEIKRRVELFPSSVY